MRAALPLMLFLALISPCVAQTTVPARYADLPGVAIYNNGYVLSWDPEYTQVTVYNRDRKPAFSVLERKDDSSTVMWAVDSDGIVAGAYQPRGLKEGRIDLLDLASNVIRTINTGSYIPQQVVFALDHTIWTASYNAANDGTQDFNVLHHYARTGEELGQALPWSQISGDFTHPVIGIIRGGQLLYVANDRIGWNAALHPGPRTWVEVSFSGVLLGKYELKTPDGLSLFPLAMTRGGNVYAMIFKSHSARFAVLDRSKGVWQKVVGDPGGGLIGSEGDNLVFFTRNGAWTTLNFVPCGWLRVEQTP
ncbi:MAG: hypothetical protein JO097_14095 [Acidobacteriaceae bacterium]|nr:hypothetical protein [Acidobacteriaceae bacterium]MBV9295526.1 hypothetical protein [Acidobacteriaceae bacterium]